MAVMRMAGNSRQLPRDVHVREVGGEYVVEFDSLDFDAEELTVETLGPVVTVRGERRETIEDDGKAFRLREHLEESFRLPDDAALDELTALHRRGTLELHAPHGPVEPRRIPIASAPRFHVNADAQAV